MATLPEHAVSDEGSNTVVERDALDRALDQLTTRQRAVLVLRYYDDMTYHQTAEALGCSVGAVKQHNARALAALRRIMPVDEVTEVS